MTATENDSNWGLATDYLISHLQEREREINTARLQAQTGIKELPCQESVIAEYHLQTNNHTDWDPAQGIPYSVYGWLPSTLLLELSWINNKQTNYGLLET